MHLIRGLQNLKKLPGSSAVTIGNFDGVHIGHRKIISQLVKKSKKLSLSSVLISFAPTPQNFFFREQASLSNFKEKYYLLRELGLDICLIIHLSQAFSQLDAQNFVQKILLNKLNMKYCLTGDDFCFGKNRRGDFKLLQVLSKDSGFTVKKASSVLCNNHRVSSSAIRTFLKYGDMQSASQMLGREFSIAGKVVHGLKNGRIINFPTINIPIKRKISPIYGVFAVTVELYGTTYQGVCNIGNRPIIKGGNNLLEIFLFNFNREVYGIEVKATFKHKITIRLQYFSNFELLKQQIKIDVKDAEDYFNKLSS